MTEKQEKIINQSVKMLTISEDEAGQRIIIIYWQN